jgi:hypothetical protein
MNGEKKNVYTVLVGKPEVRRPLGRPKHRWVDNIKLILEKLHAVVWTGLIWHKIGTSGELL